MIIDTMKNFGTYFKSEAWTQVFNYIENLNADMQTGKYYLKGEELIVNVDAYATKSMEECVLETHEKYVDIQLLLDGEEYIDIYPAADLQVKDEYDQDRDVAFYHVPEATPVRVKLVPGNFTVLFPQDAHMPQLKVTECCDVKKIVVKIVPQLLV